MRAGNAERLLFFSQYALLLLLSPHVPLAAVSRVLPAVPGAEQHAGALASVSAERAAAARQQGAPKRLSERAAPAPLSCALRAHPHHPFLCLQTFFLQPTTIQ